MQKIGPFNTEVENNKELTSPTTDKFLEETRKYRDEYMLKLNVLKDKINKKHSMSLEALPTLAASFQQDPMISTAYF